MLFCAGISGSGVGALRKHAGGMFLASDLGGYAAVVSSVLAQYDAAKSDSCRGAKHSKPGR